MAGTPDEPAAGDAPAPTPELERKFLVTALPAGYERHPSSPIEQGYLALDPEGASVRLRRHGGRTLCTIKAGHGLQRTEEEWRIDRDRFERLWPLTEGRRVQKRRYRLPADGGLTIELDVYGGDLAGLVTAEVEAPTLEQVLAFEPLPWMRLEVTDDRRYANAALAVDGVPERGTGDHALLRGEDPATGWVGVLLGELDHAAGVFGGPAALPHARAVHAARKALKRARALLRIARDGLDDDQRSVLATLLRDAGRELSGARDATVVLETFDAIAARDPDAASTAAATALRAVLAVREASAGVQEAGGGEATARALAQLADARAIASGLQLHGDAAGVLAAGLERIHRRGRKAWRAAGKADGDERTEALHELRKRTKDLWHAAELLEPAAPKQLRRLAATAHDLADLIGDDHDLAVLLEQVAAHAVETGDPDGHAPLKQAIDARRGKLQRKALATAEALYGEPIRPVAARVARITVR